MDLINRYRNLLNPTCGMVFIYDINIRLVVLMYRIWNIRDLEAKLCKMDLSHWPILVAN